jgi:kumamolisin
MQKKKSSKSAVARKSVAARAKQKSVKKTQKSSASTPARVLVPGSKRPKAKFATRIGDLDPNDRVDVTLTLKGPPLPGADDLPEKSLTGPEFERAYGASATDLAKVTAVLEKFGLSVTHGSLATRSVQVAGTAAQMEAAFRPNLGMYKDATGQEFRDRQDGYSVPKSLENLVTSIIGFGQRPVARRRGAAAKAVNALKPLAPADIEALYRFPQGSAAGKTIGIAEFGGGFFADDLAAYCNKYGRPIPKVNAIAVNRPAYTLKQILALPDAQRKDELDSSVEVMMDVEVIAGLCSGAAINVYFATFDQKGWVDLLNRAVEDRPVSLSVSWGLAEDDTEWSKAARDAINERLNAAALLGITVCVAAGDDGSGDEETDGNAHVDFPSSSPFVLAVGGTMIAGSLSPASELVWWESPGRRTQNGGGASGGGVSVFFPRPAWQTPKVASLNKGSIDGRIVPDVAAVAGDPLYDLVVLGRDAPNGGTSASAPVWAALMARIDANLPAGKQQRFATPLLYKLTSSGKAVGALGCNDVISGNNASHPKPGKGYLAGAGFDAVSGWGTPRGTDLASFLATV